MYAARIHIIFMGTSEFGSIEKGTFCYIQYIYNIFFLIYRVSRPLSPPWGRNIGQLSLKIVYHLINYYMCAHFPQNMGPYHSKLHPQWSIKLDVLPDQKSDFSLILIIKINSIMRQKMAFLGRKNLEFSPKLVKICI